MAEHPIIFNGAMVRAILGGRKTQTRRPLRNRQRLEGLMLKGEEADWCPCGKPGDTLWVREKWRPLYRMFTGILVGACFRYRGGRRVFNAEHRAWDSIDDLTAFKLSIHMPHWASQITLEVEDVRVERVREIDCESIRAEGLEFAEDIDASIMLTEFKCLWNSLYTKRGYGWDKNPWVWCIKFKLVDGCCEMLDWDDSGAAGCAYTKRGDG